MQHLNHPKTLQLFLFVHSSAFRRKTWSVVTVLLKKVRNSRDCIGCVFFTFPYNLVAPNLSWLWLHLWLALFYPSFAAPSQFHSIAETTQLEKKLTKKVLRTLKNQAFSASPPCKWYEANQLWTKLGAEIGMDYTSYLNWIFFPLIISLLYLMKENSFRQLLFLLASFIHHQKHLPLGFSGDC